MKWVRAIVTLLLAGAALLGARQPARHVPRARQAPRSVLRLLAERGAAPTPSPDTLRVPGLRGEVRVVWDDRRVPHIFAANDHDLFLAQGYVAATLRLWQMDFQSLYTAGRISEVVGPATVRQDVFTRRFGLPWAAANADPGLPVTTRGRRRPWTPSRPASTPASPTSAARACRSSSRSSTTAPSPGRTIKCALLLKAMAYILAAYNQDAAMTRMKGRGAEWERGHQVPSSPTIPPLVDPVIPPGTPLDFTPLPVPGARARPGGRGARPETRPRSSGGESPATRAARRTAGRPVRQAASSLPDAARRRQQQLGRRAAGLTKAGFPILCNDMHLELCAPGGLVRGPALGARGSTSAGSRSRPRPWSSPDTTRTSPGASPTAPTTSSTGTTSGSRTIRAPNISTPANGGKRPCARRRSRSGAARRSSTRSSPPTTARSCAGRTSRPSPRWTSRPGRPCAGSATTRRTSSRRSTPSTGPAITANTWRPWRPGICPAQNFVYADRQGTIALWHNGRFPLRWKGQGRFVMDGADPAERVAGLAAARSRPPRQGPGAGLRQLGQPGGGRRHATPIIWAGTTPPTSAGRGSTRSCARRATSRRRTWPGCRPTCWTSGPGPSCRACSGSSGRARRRTTERRCLTELRAWNLEARAALIAPTVWRDLWNELERLTWDDEATTETGRMPRPASQILVDLVLNRPGAVVVRRHGDGRAARRSMTSPSPRSARP